jgi:predicted GIY-YIG superfamily endonuclease
MYLYIIKVQKPSRKCFYVGITNDIKRRYKQHLMGIGSKWAKRYFKGAKKVLAFVGYMPYGVLWAAMEKKVKSLPPRKKEALIASKYNILEGLVFKQRMWSVDVDVYLKSITNENMLRNLDGT